MSRLISVIGLVNQSPRYERNIRSYPEIVFGRNCLRRASLNSTLASARVIARARCSRVQCIWIGPCSDLPQFLLRELLCIGGIDARESAQRDGRSPAGYALVDDPALGAGRAYPQTEALDLRIVVDDLAALGW